MQPIAKCLTQKGIVLAGLLDADEKLPVKRFVL